MSRRVSIVNAIAEKLKVIDGTAPYKSNIYGNAFAKLKFWDEISDFSSIFVVTGSESREYMPGAFAWGFLNASIKVYCKGEDSQTELEDLLEDVEKVLDGTLGIVVYDETNGYETSEISITSITTDEGLLAPYAVGEINILIRYQIMK
jgi:hypothetical protein